MRRILGALAVCVLIGASPPPSPHWSAHQMEQLARWKDTARNEALQIKPRDIMATRLGASQQERDEAATATANDLLAAYREGCCNRAARREKLTGVALKDGAAALPPHKP